MRESGYSALVEDLFREPRFVGYLADLGAGRASGEAGSVEQGAWVRFHLRIDGGRVTDARFQAYGCPHTLAAAEWLCRQLAGKTLAQSVVTLSRGDNGGASQLLETLEAPQHKLGRMLIVEDALRSSLEAAQRGSRAPRQSG
jgi:NifU-like protein involved in Fe-S cluster formation